MKTTFFLPVILIIIAASQAFGQNEELKTIYNREAIGFYGDTRFMRGTEIMSRREVKSYLLKQSESAAEYRLFQKRKRVGNAIAILAGSVYASSFFLLGQNPDAAIGCMAGSVAVAAVAIPFQVKARKNLQKSVYLYNRDVLVCK
jgi:hypothetical protein